MLLTQKFVFNAWTSTFTDWSVSSVFQFLTHTQVVPLKQSFKMCKIRFTQIGCINRFEIIPVNLEQN